MAAPEGSPEEEEGGKEGGEESGDEKAGDGSLVAPARAVLAWECGN